MRRLQVPLPAHTLGKAELERYWQDYGVPNHKRICAFDSIQIALAPVIETIILLDRIVFMREQGHDAQLVGLFDQSTSPRFAGIIATKRKDT